MAAAAKPENDAPGTAVTTTSERIANTRAALRERNELVAAIRGTQWGRDTTPQMARAVAHYCHENGLDPVRHVEILGGRIYLTAEFYDEKGAALIRAGHVIPDEPDIISADPRLDDLAAKGDEWAVTESTRRIRERIKHGVPEKSLAAVVQRFRLATTGQAVIGVNWCGGNGRRDPVGDAEPTKTATTRARRRAWKQIADVIPEYGRLIKPIEATARVASEQLPIDIVEAPHRPRALVTDGTLPYDAGAAVNNAPAPPAQFEDSDELFPDDIQQKGRDALRDG